MADRSSANVIEGHLSKSSGHAKLIGVAAV